MALTLCSALPVAAHEFWISPQAYRIAAGETISADIRVGQGFEGPASIYLPRGFARFDTLSATGVAPVEGRMGDRPAARIDAAPEGLVVVIHETTDSVLTYKEFEQFAEFTRHKDFAWAIEEHAARGLPETGFRETYRRYAKALVAVGDGAGGDRRVGLTFELVAQANPYTDDLSGGLAVQLWQGDAPLPDTQIELFARAPDTSVQITRHRTDADGLVQLPMQPGTEYLVDAVVLSPRDPATETQGAAWHSDWAALTFKTPEG